MTKSEILFIIPGSPKCVLPSILWFSSLFLSVCLSFLPLLLIFLLHPGVPVILFPPPPPPPLFHPLPGLAGPRPYGLEEDVRQYEQDLAKRLYQARVRASQGTPEPPTSSTSSSAASQLRSAPRPQPPGPDARHRGGCAGVLLALGYFARGRVQKGPSKHSQQHCDRASPAAPFCCCLASARLCCF